VLGVVFGLPLPPAPMAIPRLPFRRALVPARLQPDRHAADVLVAATLGRLCGESNDEVLLAAALAVRALRERSVCLDLADATRSTGSSVVLLAGEDEARGQAAPVEPP
jgi:hypothetical protein